MATSGELRGESRKNLPRLSDHVLDHLGHAADLLDHDGCLAHSGLNRIELRRTTGLCHRVGADPWIAGLAARMDGQRRLGELIHELAAAVGQPEEDIRGEVLEIVRQLLLKGIVELPE